MVWTSGKGGIVDPNVSRTVLLPNTSRQESAHAVKILRFAPRVGTAFQFSEGCFEFVLVRRVSKNAHAAFVDPLHQYGQSQAASPIERLRIGDYQV
jgi:hypothetical protein